MTLMQRFLIGWSAAIGGVIAALADMVQKGETASAIIKMSGTLETIFRSGISPIFVIVLIVGLGVALSFIFEADTKQRSFFIGASILSIIMTFVPIEALPNLPQSPTVPNLQLQPTGLGLLQPSAAFAQEPNAPQNVQVQLHLEPKDGEAISKAIISVKDVKTRKIIGRSVIATTAYDFYLAPGDYIITVEVPGYLREYRRVSVEEGEPQSLNLPLKPTLIPLPFQRLF